MSEYDSKKKEEEIKNYTEEFTINRIESQLAEKTNELIFVLFA